MNSGMHNFVKFKLKFIELVNSDENKFEAFDVLTVCVCIDDKRSSLMFCCILSNCCGG